MGFGEDQGHQTEQKIGIQKGIRVERKKYMAGILPL
jgi:hypothetical protein